MKTHEPSESAAPPVSAWPDVQPRARRAAKPIRTPPATASAKRCAVFARGPFSMPSFSRPAEYAPRTPPRKTPRTSNTSQSSRTCLPGPKYCEKYAFVSTAFGATRWAPATAKRVTAPDEPRPKPMTRNDARRTRPRTTPATYGFQKGRSDISLTSSAEKPEGRGLAGREKDPAQREAAREDQDGDERDEREVPPGLEELHREGDEEPRDDDERPEDGRVRPAEEAARREAARLAGGRPAEKEEDDQDELGADRDGVPADEELPLCFVQTEEEQRRGAGRDARREEERPEDRAVPREARGHRAEEEARVEAKADAHEDARHEDGAAVRACEVREPREKDTEEGRRPRAEPRALRRVERAEAEEEAGRVDEDENPRAPGHRRGRAKDGVKAPRPEPMREVEPERQHAHREERERRERRRPQGARERARTGDELQRGREDEDPRDDPAEEEVDRDLEAPDVERRVDLRMRAGRDGLAKLRRHGRSLRAGSRGSAARRSRGDSLSSGAFEDSSRPRSRGRGCRRRRASRSGTRSHSPASAPSGRGGGRTCTCRCSPSGARSARRTGKPRCTPCSLSTCCGSRGRRHPRSRGSRPSGSS